MGLLRTIGQLLRAEQPAEVHLQADDETLKQLGYKQVLKRDMSLFSNFAISFSIISILTGVTGAFGLAMTYGGPVTAVWGWPLVALFSFVVALCMGEICSAYPTCGGLYFWAARLAGPRWAPMASWVTGWFNLLGQLAVTAGIAFSCVTFLCEFVTIATGGANGGGFEFNTKQMLGIYAGLLVICGILNSVHVKVAAVLNDVSAWYHVVATVVIIIVLPSLATVKQPADWVFSSFAQNGDTTGVTSGGYIFLLGLLMSQWTITGFDASAHMSEETQAAALAGPLGICSSVVISFIFGWGFILALVFCISDAANLFSPDTVTGGAQPVFQIFWDVVYGRFGNGMGALALAIIPTIAAFFATVSSIGSNCRMLFAFSRDGAVPGSKLWTQVHPGLQIPLNAVWGMVVGAFILGMPMLDNITTFTAVTSIATIGLYISYALPIIFKLLVAQNAHWTPGPFNLGALSIPLNIIAVCWVCFISVVFCLPTIYPITQATMNFAPVAVGGVLVLSLGWWVIPKVGARHWFQGPPHEGDATNTDWDISIKSQTAGSGSKAGAAVTGGGPIMV